ncbi:hypothetical protein [Paenibacillus sp. OK003]|uniref:hypothetical protein n=1 Tax=Paenibacillus sp. OK003 TaxID=1884380 RepID=UPI0008B922F1|nr:hypothetical protein [Paenibacillus sp. OK003]SEL31592.1 hypothetical protein SAMN05518856_109269 [Paenibacillus sp. OK003]
MSAEHFIVAIVPTLIVFLFVTYAVIKTIFKDSYTIFRKIIIRYSIISILICFLFSAIYAFILTFEVAQALELKNSSLTNVTGFKLKGDSFPEFLLRIFIFSASTFFQLPSSISFEGLAQIIVIVQRFLGVTAPLLTVGLTLFDEQRKKSGNLILYTFLNRGWNILRIRDGYAGGKYKTLELIGADLTIKPIFINDERSVKEELKYFMVDWSTINKDVLPFFLKVVDEPLLDKGHLWSEATVLFQKRDINSLEFCEEYIILLEEIDNQFTGIDEISINKDINIIISRLRGLTDNLEEKNHE